MNRLTKKLLSFPGVVGYSAALLALAFAAPGGIGIMAVARAADFYVAEGGNDSLDGLSPNAAWGTLGKINGQHFSPGDRVLFKRGNVWRGRLVIPSSGTDGNPVTFGAYGTGERPVIVGASLAVAWAQGGSKVWHTAVRAEPYQVFFNGVRGVKQAARNDLNSANGWYWEPGKLYVYSTSDPAVAYSQPGIEFSLEDCVFAWQKSHVLVENMEVMRGKYGFYLGGGSSGISFVSVRSSQNHYDGLMIDGLTCSDVTFIDCEAQDNSRHGVHAHGARNVTVAGGSYQGHTQRYGSGVAINGVQGGTVSAVNAYGNFYGIKAANGANQIVIERNNVHDNLDFGIDLDIHTTNSTIRQNEVTRNGSHGIMVELDAESCVVSRNLCYRNGSEHAGIFVEQATDVIVSYNIVRDEYIGIRFNEGSTNCAAYNNVTHNISGVAFSAFNNCSGITWKNNIASACSYLAVHVRADSQTDFVSDHNNWFAPGDKLRWGSTSYTFDEWTGNTGQDLHSLASDPQFVSSGMGDFHVRPSSPCIDAGEDVGLTEDYEGTGVPIGPSADTGAYECGTGETPQQQALHVQSMPEPGVFVTGTPAGMTSFSADLDAGSEVCMIAPLSYEGDGGGYSFVQWTVNGEAQLPGQATIVFDIRDHSIVVAVYESAAANLPPLAEAGPDQIAGVGQEVRLDGSVSFDPDGQIVDWSWDVDGDSLADAAGEVASHTFDLEGDHAVTLRVADDLGATGEDGCMVSVVPALHVGSIDLMFSGNGKRVAVKGLVEVLDHRNLQTNGAVVTVTWQVNGAVVASDTAKTRHGGVAVLTFRSLPLRTGDTVTLTVDNIETSYGLYAAGDNVETRDSIVVL